MEEDENYDNITLEDLAEGTNLVDGPEASLNEIPQSFPRTVHDTSCYHMNSRSRMDVSHTPSFSSTGHQRPARRAC